MSKRARRLAILLTAGLVGGTLGATGVVVPAVVAHHTPGHTLVTMQVNVLYDAVDVDPGDGVCSTGETLPGGEEVCTLRAAVQETNAMWIDIDQSQWHDFEILLVVGTPEAPAVHELTIAGAGENAGATGDLDIRAGIRIRGGNVEVWDEELDDDVLADVSVIDATAIGDRAIDVIAADEIWGRLDAYAFTIRGGSAPQDEDGGGVRSVESALFEDVRLTDNEARDGGGAWLAGVDAVGVEVVGNTAHRDGGGLWLGEVDRVVGEVRGNTAARNGGGMAVLGSSGSQPHVAGTIVGNSAGAGGGIWVRLESGSSLDVDARIDQNSAEFGGGIGAALGTDASFDIDDSMISGNTATVGGGGGVWIAGVDNTGSVGIDESTFVDNTAADGGGLWIGPSPLGTDEEPDADAVPAVHLRDIRFSDNEAIERYDELDDSHYGGSGGAMWIGGNAEVFGRNIAVISNVAGVDGGGLSIDDGADVDLGWSTIAQNTAGNDDNSGEGGGIWVDDATLRLVNSTLSSNIAGSGGALYADSHDGIVLEHVTATENVGRQSSPAMYALNAEARASVIAGNVSEEEGYEQECGADLVSLGYNLLAPGCFPDLEEGDIIVDLDGDGVPITGLGPLAVNGGFEEWPAAADDDVLDDRSGRFAWESDVDLPLTHAPGDLTSPVVDAGPEECLQTDQRQVPRPVGSACDIGAIEYVATLADLEIGAGWANPVPLGTPFTFSAWVSNYGPDEFGTAVFSLSLPPELAYVSDDGGCDYSAGELTCTVSDADTDIAFTAMAPLVPGIYSWVMSFVSSATTDPDPHNQEEAGSGSVLVFEESVPGPGGADSDADGVHDDIDVDSAENDVDGPGDYMHGGTYGKVIVMNGHAVFVQPDPGAPDPAESRVLISVTPTSESSVDRAHVTACGFTLRMMPPSGAIVVCGSLSAEIVEGAVDVELPNGAIVSVPEGVTAHIDETAPGTFTITHQGGTGSIVVTVGGIVRPPIGPGAPPLVIAPPTPDPPDDQCKEKKDKGKSEKSKSKSDKGKNDKCKDPKPTPKPKPTKTEKPKDPKPKPTKTEKPKDPKPTKTDKPKDKDKDKDPKPKPTKTEKPKDKKDDKSKDKKSNDSKSKDSKKSSSKEKTSSKSTGKNQPRSR